MNWKGELAQYLTFVAAPFLGALGVVGAIRWSGLDRLDPRRFAALAVAAFLVTRVGTHVAVFHVFRYPGTVDLTDFWQPMARAVLDGKNPGPWADNMSGPLYPFVLAAGLAISGARYVAGINAVFVAADAVAMWLLLRIARRHLPENLARRVVLAALLSPMIWVGDTACSQDEVIFACLLLATLDLAETGRVGWAMLCAAMGTLCTKALFPFWVLPILLATSGDRATAVRRVVTAGALTVAGIAIAVALGFDLTGHAAANRIVRGTTPWAFFVPSMELAPDTYRAGLAVTAALCVLAAFVATRGRAGESVADRAVRGVVAVQAAFFVASPYSLDYHLAHAWPFVAWLLVREGAAAPRLGRAAAVLAAGYCVLPMIGFGIGAEGISARPLLLLAFTGWCAFTGWRALRPLRTTEPSWPPATALGYAPPVTDERPVTSETQPSHGPRATAPFLVAAVLYAAILARAVVTSRGWTDGTIRYGCDDAYIHLAYAKQFAASGVWGVAPGEFAHASSSPMWVVLLSGLFKITGPFTAAPLVLNVLASLGVLWVLHAAMLRRGVATLTAVAANCALVVVVPLPWLTMTGMEHVLQLLADLVLGLLVVRMLDDDAPAPRRTAFACAVAAVVVATRLEGAFLVAAASGLLVLRRRWGTAIALSACGAAPVVAIGLVAMSHGWGFLPSSIALKGEMPSFSTPHGVFNALGGHGLANWASSPELVCLTIATVVAAGCAAASARRPRVTPLLVLTVCATLLHCQFAWILGRYTAYLMGLGVAGVALAWPDVPAALRRPVAARVAWVAALVPLVWHGVLLEAKTPLAVKNIYEQQGQLVRVFGAKGESPVALNDVGAVSYFDGVHVVDVWGLVTREVAAARTSHTYTTARMDEICREHGVRAAAIYDAWFDGRECPKPPATWTRVGTWRIADNVVCGSDVVTFYAVDAESAALLRARLVAFAPTLPSGVTQTLE